MKYLMFMAFVAIISSNAFAQAENQPKKKGTEKAVDKAKEINNKSKEISDASNQVADQAKQTAENIKNTANNIKSIIKIFEPILSFHFKKNKNKNMGGSSSLTDSTNNTPTNNQSQQQTGNANMGNANSNNGNTMNNNDGTMNGNNNNMGNANNNSSQQSMYGQPESPVYNADGTMNLGHQNNGLFGNCINLMEAKVMGMGEAEDNPSKIDLIFFASPGGLSYSLESPLDAPTINEGVDVKKWATRNETEIAESKLTLSQFEKITTNPALINAVKNTSGFKAYFYTPNKMDGRVFAIKLQQDDRELNALMAVYKQMGTSGSNGYLKIKIKVQGIDKNGDGNPDAGAYIRQ